MLVIANMDDRRVEAQLDLPHQSRWSSVRGARTLQSGEVTLDSYEFDWLQRAEGVAR
jgi:hypothetical protein